MHARKQKAEAGEPSKSARIGRILRQYFFSGLATLFPLAVTLYVVVFIVRVADSVVQRFLGVTYPGVGLVVGVTVIIFTGMLSVHFLGRFILSVLEFWLNRLPFIRKIYPTVKQFAGFIFEPDAQKAAFRQVVLVQYPRQGSYTIGFVTNESDSDILGEKRRLLTVLIPLPPSPFTGPIVIVPKEEVIPVDMSIEDAFKLVISAGVVQKPLLAGSWDDNEQGDVNV